MTKRADYFAILLEEMNAQFKVVIEAVDDIRRQLAGKPNRDEFDELTADIKTVKSVVSGHSDNLRDHERRLRRIEKAV